MGFKFTETQRSCLMAVLPVRLSRDYKEKFSRYGKNPKEVFAVHTSLLLEDTEAAIDRFNNNQLLKSIIPKSELRKELSALSSSARAVSKSIERLRGSERIEIEGKYLISIICDREIPEVLKMGLLNGGFPILLKMVKALEESCESSLKKPPSRGPDKEDEYNLAMAIALSFSFYIGKASFSPNGSLYAFIREVSGITNILVGGDLLKRVVKTSPHLFR